uniref:Uncharacterized protein n=1 Tax=Siphoviridae sp. ctYOF2 TaxID=2826376 RepID=A0A8S5MA57_9CAUD|nr:MAG TPA: hypothetical protein [Siphoviridae sp. ctYOF2]
MRHQLFGIIGRMEKDHNQDNFSTDRSRNYLKDACSDLIWG